MSDDENVPNGDDADHELPEDELNYPTLEFEDGNVAADGSFDLSRTTDYDEMGEWATALAGALGSHDLGVSTPEGFVTFGVAPRGVDATFEPGENHRGELELTFRLSAKAMLVADAEDELPGARGDSGFVPLSTLTDEEELLRCYNWIDDPENPE